MPWAFPYLGALEAFLHTPTPLLQDQYVDSLFDCIVMKRRKGMSKGMSGEACPRGCLEACPEACPAKLVGDFEQIAGWR